MFLRKPVIKTLLLQFRSFAGIARVSEGISGCCWRLGRAMNGLRGVRWVSYGGSGAGNGGLGDAGELPAVTVLRCTPCSLPIKNKSDLPW